MARTPGLLGRKKSNFDPTDPYIPNEDSVVTKSGEDTPTFSPIIVHSILSPYHSVPTSFRKSI